MAYYLNLFSPETYAAFSRSSKTLSGFRLRQSAAAERVRPGDVFVCYVTKVSRWCGLLDVAGGPFLDPSSIFAPQDDPFVVRFQVFPRIWLPLDRALPIHDAAVWNGLSFTQHVEPGSTAWAAHVRASLARLDDNDGDLLTELLTARKA